jgi:transcriptional regulator with XRE-family HTH domain
MLCVVNQSKHVFMDSTRQKHVEWVNAILDIKGWTQTELARKAGLDPSTLSRFLREENPGARLNTYTIERIEHASGMHAFETSIAAPMRGMAEGEATPWLSEDSNSVTDIAVLAIKGEKNHIVPWVLKSAALELAGYIHGDILFVDLNGNPNLGDVVCAQVYDRFGKAETVFRIYEKPYLVAASTEAHLRRPILTDDDRAQIRGVVIATLRPRNTN